MTLIETSSRPAQIGNALLDHHHLNHLNHHHHHHHHLHTQSQLPNFTSNSSSPLINHRVRDNLNINLSTIQHANPFEDHYNISLSSTTNEPAEINDSSSASYHKQNNSNIYTNHSNDVKVQVYYCGLILVVYVNDKIKVKEFY